MAMQTMGIFDNLITLIRAAIHPLSELPEHPSTSSITMTVLRIADLLKWWSIVDDSVRSFSIFSITFFDRLSEALMNIVSRPRDFATIETIDVLPIPGEPDIKHAFAVLLTALF